MLFPILMRALVTGGAGFIGSSLVDRLLADGHQVIAFDNFSTGQKPFLADAATRPGFGLVRRDTLDPAALDRGGARRGRRLPLRGERRRAVRHRPAAAGPRAEHDRDVQRARSDVRQRCACGLFVDGIDLRRGRRHADARGRPFPVQTSLYGVSTLAGEGLIQAYCEGFGFRAWIFRFVSILGERYTHGHVFDFYRSLRVDRTRLRVLGNGSRTSTFRTASTQLSWRWIGDNPFISLDTTGIRSLGWTPRLTIREAVIRTLDYLRSHPELLGTRE